MKMLPQSYGELSFSPIGRVCVYASDKGLTAVRLLPLDAQLAPRPPAPPGLDAFLVINQALTQLSDYLAGKLTAPFSTPLDWSGISAFQQAVLQETLRIPYGTTSTYAAIAQKLGKSQASRAVGRALATNPFLIFVPCHRVVGSDGSLHGFSAPGGVKTKAWLLDFEKSHAPVRTGLIT